MICLLNNGDLLEFFLRKLPKDVSEALLTQQSKGRLNSVSYLLMFIYSALSDIYTNLQPLHIAVKLGHIRLVKLIVEFSKSSILMLDVDGQTTLHAAVKLCYAQVTSILLAAADPKVLQMENGVGSTPFDIISLRELSSRIDGFAQTDTMSLLQIDGVEPFYRYTGDYIQKLQKELPKLHAILEVLLADGRLKRQTKLAKELTKFASMMKERLSAAEAAHTARLARFPKEEEEISADPKDSYDLEKTYSIIVGALKGLTVNRQLIHLIDVQKSVGADLEKVGNRLSDEQRIQKGEGELEAEEDEEEEEKAQSMVWQYTANVYVDSF